MVSGGDDVRSRGNVKEIIEERINDWVLKSARMTWYQKPLIGYADVKDPLFNELKERLPHHLMPGELLENAKTVVAFFVPFAEEVAESNRGGEEVSEQWARAYVETNALINEICGKLAAELPEIGVNVGYQKATHNFDEKTLTAAWSHKSVAYIAGLGTFGVNRMLITPKGCSGRFGSFVIDQYVEPSERPKQEYCLNFQGKKCLKCMESCPVGALSETGIDKHLCYQRLLTIAPKYNHIGLADVCGKCVGPCANYK